MAQINLLPWREDRRKESKKSISVHVCASVGARCGLYIDG